MRLQIAPANLVVELTDANDIELKASFKKFLLNLHGDAVETDMASRKDGISLRHSGSHDGARCLGRALQIANGQVREIERPRGKRQ